MQIPSWLANATGAQQFANNPMNGFQPTLGDALQGIGHSMMEHYRRDGSAPNPTPAAPSMLPSMTTPQVPAPPPGPQGGPSISEQIQTAPGMQQPWGLPGVPLGLLGPLLGGQGGIPLGLAARLMK